MKQKTAIGYLSIATAVALLAVGSTGNLLLAGAGILLFTPSVIIVLDSSVRACAEKRLSDTGEKGDEAWTAPGNPEMESDHAVFTVSKTGYIKDL